MTLIILLFTFVTSVVGMYPCNRTEQDGLCRLQTSKDLRHPVQLLSRHNLLEFELQVAMSKVTFGGWLDLWRRTYNGRIGGPTLRVRPGDTVSARLENQLEPDERQGAVNSLRNPNTTNIYLHGLHVSPKINDATTEVGPGQVKTYAYQIGCDHPPGTYWYHPQFHGSSMFQTLSGMAGMIVVEDDVKEEKNPNSISYYSCPKHCDHEVQLLFQPTLLYQIGEDGFSFARVQQKIGDYFRSKEKMSDGRSVEDWLISRRNKVHFFTTNGQIEPTIRIEAGKTMRFRMVNAGGIHVLELVVPSACEIEEIARDGLYLSEPSKPQNGKSILPQGGTMDWLVRCDSPGTYELKSSPEPRMHSGLSRSVRYSGNLARIHVVESMSAAILKGEFISANFHERPPISLPSLPKYLPNLMSLPSDHVTGRFVVETCANNILNRRKYDGKNITVSYQMPSGNVQEWNLLNADASNSHTLHVQGHHFQVVGYNEYKGPVSIATRSGNVLVDLKRRVCNSNESDVNQISLKKAGMGQHDYRPYSGNGLAPIGQWRNTIILPPLSNTTIRLRPRHFVGKSMIHSHNLLKADFGMKIVIEVVGKGQQHKTLQPKSGLPGTCESDDFYPTVNQSPLILGKNDFEGFFTWLYSYKPIYKEKYGDQRYLSSIYMRFLNEHDGAITNGEHMSDFFHWIYSKFSGYKEHYGDQSYLAELYDYYLSINGTQGRKE